MDALVPLLTGSRSGRRRFVTIYPQPNASSTNGLRPSSISDDGGGKSNFLTTPVALFAFTLYFSVHSSAFASTLSTPIALLLLLAVMPGLFCSFVYKSPPSSHTPFNISSLFSFCSTHSTVKIWISCRHFPLRKTRRTRLPRRSPKCYHTEVNPWPLVAIVAQSGTESASNSPELDVLQRYLSRLTDFRIR